MGGYPRESGGAAVGVVRLFSDVNLFGKERGATERGHRNGILYLSLTGFQSESGVFRSDLF